MQTRILASTFGRLGRAFKTVLLGAVVAILAIAAAPGAQAQVSPPDMDVNQDSVVDVVDVQLTVNVILAIFTPTYSTQGDANYDGVTDVVDVQTVVNRILGFTTPFSLSTRPVEATVATPFSSVLFAYAGAPPYSFSATGLPAGVTLSPSGTLSGTLAVSATYDLSVTVTQASGSSVNAIVRLVVGGGGGSAAPVFVSSAVTDAFVGQLYTYNILTSGNPTPSISITNRPTWLTLNGSTLSGTPSMAHIGYTNTITLTAFNGISPNANQSFVIAVNSGGPTPAITSSPNTTATLGQLYSYTAIATGTPPATISFSGLPPWLIQNNRTISGTPAAGDAGQNYNIVVTASNGNLPNAVQNYILAVVGAGAPPTITSSPTTVSTLFTNYSYTVAASGTPAATIFASNLPLWATLTGSTISGMPGPGDAGTTGIITVTAANGVGSPATQSFTIVISRPEIPSQAPEILFEYPSTTSGGSGPIASNAKIVIVFSEAVFPTNMTMSLNEAAAMATAPASNGPFTGITSTMSFASGLSGMDNRILIVQPSANLAASHALLTLWGRRVATGTAGAGILDGVGNSLVTAYADASFGSLNNDPAVALVWNHTGSADSSAPTRASTSPTASSSGNSPNTPISVTFSEPVNPATLAASFLVSDGQGAVPGAVSMNYATLTTATFTPSRALVGTVQVAIAGVQDLAGNGASALQNFNFSVSADNQPPVISFLTVNALPSHINGDVSFGGGSLGGGRIQVPQHGFTIDVRYSEPGGAGVSRTLADHHISANVQIGPAPANTNVAGTFPAGNVHIAGDRALFVVPPTMALAVGQATLTVRIRDLAGNLSSPVTYTITVKAATNEILPLEGSPETWQLYFNRDHETTIFNFPSNIINSANNDNISPNSTPDFTEDLTGHGFMGGSGASGFVNSGGGLQIQQAARHWVINRLVYHLYALYGMSIPFTDGNPNPGFDSPFNTATPTTTVSSPNLRFVNNNALPPPATPRMAFGGIPGTMVLGRASFDPNNLTRSEDNGTTPGSTDLGVFTLHDLKVNYTGSAPSAASPVRFYFDATSPFAAAGPTPQPLGTHADDPFIVDPMQNPATFTGARLTRYTNVMRAMDAFARGWAFVTAHEIGHSLGLVKDNPPGAGLYGGMPAAFPNSTTSHINLLSFMQGSGTNIMAPSLPFERSRSRFSAFNELEVAYLLGTALAD